MTIYTKAVIPGHFTIEALKEILDENYIRPANKKAGENVYPLAIIDSRYSREPDFVSLVFNETSDEHPGASRLRNMSVALNSYCAGDYNDVYVGEQTSLLLGASGDSEEIVLSILAETGGWINAFDTNDEWVHVEKVDLSKLLDQTESTQTSKM